ncbi:tRNA/rRNA methyltransferase [Chitinivorax tropicus]|uniref:tRNA (cytidine/uridine-2'-O-)-methyltransferase TrmJ n=1 Tax=Chitinivorax tropicus TaxID=714531 RepID=A0A840MRA5_9PROT|nr:RNA methyltransferase [Chitinivorax tropicus]MBB5017751.1 tRNA/rRNA methyltransferase [Chitinivorax tropicus]
MADHLDRIRIVLTNPSHPGNIGSAARAMKVMGITKLYLVNPKEFPNDHADALASGAVDVLRHATVCGSLSEALQGVGFAAALSARRRELTLPAENLREAATQAMHLAAHNEIAFVFGNETFGLSNEEVMQCNLLIHVPTNPEYCSLNLAAAVQLVCYELRMAAGLTRFDDWPTPPTLATQEQIEGMLQHLEATLIEIGYLNPANPKRLMPRLRRLYKRATLEVDEIDMLRGILTKTLASKRSQ